MILTIIIILGCNQDDDKSNLTYFDVAVITESNGDSHNSLNIRWTESKSRDNSNIHYEVYISENGNELNFQLYDANIDESRYTSSGNIIIGNYNYYIPYADLTQDYKFSYRFLNLEENKSWVIKVIAVDENGNRTSSYTDAVTTTNPFPYVGCWEGTYSATVKPQFMTPQNDSGSLIMCFGVDGNIGGSATSNVFPYDYKIYGNLSNGNLTINAYLEADDGNNNYPVGKLIGTLPTNSNEINDLIMSIDSNNTETIGSWYATRQ
ncbi:hypothetical protein EYD45_04210 [Hyunsoonleella flava]|uniref:Uncharacterized protein n=1 Tax=Hyunsoonleella flava TaxID=2527939 RepID=A0A4Q9FKZ0_9FLAO|nr:hypothetical protein [Hyunsoonleella flava]TBN05488.1 hypothetical protein EYD45_04210 [Hyunsoonleella flava]